MTGNGGRKRGGGGRRPSAPPASTPGPAVGVEPDRLVLPLVEETVRVETRERVAGRVRVQIRTTSREEVAAADLASEGVEIGRRAVNREIDAVPPVRTEGDVTIVPVVEEVLVVETRLVLREEIHIRRTRSTERFETPVVLRRQDATVSRLAGDGTDDVDRPAGDANGNQES